MKFFLIEASDEQGEFQRSGLGVALDEVKPELRFHGLRNLTHLQGESRIFKAFHHLALTKFTKIPAAFARRAERMILRQIFEALTRLEALH